MSTRLRTVVGWRFGGLVIASLIQAVTYVLLARMLGAAGFGAFTAFFAAGGLAYSVLGFGFTPLALRTTAGPDGDRVRAIIVTARIAVTCLIVAAFAVIGTILVVDATVVTVAIGFVVVDAIADVCQAALAGMRRMRLATVLLLAQRLALFVTVLIAMATHSVVQIIIVALIAAVINVLCVLRARPQVREVAGLIGRSRGYWATNLAAAISQIEYPVVAALGGTSMAGIYGASSRAAGPVVLAAQALLQVTTPELTVAETAERKRLFLRLRTYTVWLIAGSIIVAVPAGLIISWVLGPGFEQAWVVAAGFVVGGAIMATNQVHQAALLALDQPLRSAGAVAVGASLGVAVAAAIALSGNVALLCVVPVITQATMLVRFHRAVAELL